MNRLSIIRHLLVAGSLLLAVPSLSACALESSGDAANAGETGTDDLVEGAKDDPSVVHSGTSGNVGLQLAPGNALRTPEVLESGEGEGPQPQPWVPKLAIRSTSDSSGSSKNK